MLDAADADALRLSYCYSDFRQPLPPLPRRVAMRY